MLQRTIIQLEKTLNDSDTYSTRIPSGKKISALEVIVKGTNGSTNNQDNDICSIVTKIKVRASNYGLIKDYGENHGGINCQGIGFFRTGTTPPDVLDEGPDVVQTGHFIIPFGRTIGDKQVFLDTDRFDNPELSVTSNLTNNKATGATGYVSGTQKIQVLAWEFVNEPDLHPVGFVKTQELKEFESSASGQTDVDLTMEDPVMSFYVRAYESGTLHSDSITKVKIYPYVDDEETEYIRYSNRVYYGTAEVSKAVHKTDGDTVETRIGFPHSVIAGSRDTGYYPTITSWTAGKATIKLTSGAGAAATADQYVDVHAVGEAYQNMIVIPFDVYGDLAHLPKPQDLPRKAYLTNGNAGATVNVLADMYVDYSKVGR